MFGANAFGWMYPADGFAGLITTSPAASGDLLNSHQSAYVSLWIHPY